MIGGLTSVDIIMIFLNSRKSNNSTHYFVFSLNDSCTGELIQLVVLVTVYQNKNTTEPTLIFFFINSPLKACHSTENLYMFSVILFQNFSGKQLFLKVTSILSQFWTMMTHGRLVKLITKNIEQRFSTFFGQWTILKKKQNLMEADTNWSKLHCAHRWYYVIYCSVKTHNFQECFIKDWWNSLSTTRNSGPRLVHLDHVENH